MKKLKSFLLKLPEFLLILTVVYYWISSEVLLNPIAIGLILLLVLQVIIKNKILGFAISGMLIISCLYMVLALISEFNEFPVVNNEALTLLFVGLSILASVMFIAGLMIYKYSQSKTMVKIL